MKKWKYGILATALLIGLAVPGGAWAAGTTGNTVAGPIESGMRDNHEDHGHGQVKIRHGMHRSVHQKMYMTLLAEKYAPNTVGEWQAVFQERERLMAQWKEARKATGQDANRQLKHEKAKEENDDSRRARMEQFRQTHEAFDAAIESGDAEKIKEVLPKLLEQMKAKNERLVKKLAETKK
jgi:hypothetical protein